MPLSRAQTRDQCSQIPWPLILLVAGLLAVAGIIQWSTMQDANDVTFDEPIDALSVTFADATHTTTVQGFDGEWTETEDLQVEMSKIPLSSNRTWSLRHTCHESPLRRSATARDSSDSRRS